jgi:PilZ domain
VSEKRTEFRIPLMARVDVLWEDEDGSPRVAPATLEDKSRGGVSVRMKAAIADGSHITIKWGDEHVSGIVTNCRRQKAQYVVGVRRSASEASD